MVWNKLDPLLCCEVGTEKNKRKECMGSSLDQCSSDFRSCESPGEFLKMHILFQKVRTGS